MQTFEGEYISYMLNQARMPFFVTGCYSHYKVEGGQLVPDNGPESQELRKQALEARDLITRIQSRVKRGMRIPHTWVKTLDDQTSLVLALEEAKAATPDWCQQFHRSVRWLKSLTA